MPLSLDVVHKAIEQSAETIFLWKCWQIKTKVCIGFFEKNQQEKARRKTCPVFTKRSENCKLKRTRDRKYKKTLFFISLVLIVPAASIFFQFLLKQKVEKLV